MKNQQNKKRALKKLKQKRYQNSAPSWINEYQLPYVSRTSCRRARRIKKMANKKVRRHGKQYLDDVNPKRLTYWATWMMF